MEQLFEEDWPLIDKISGWLTKDEAKVLYVLASHSRYPIVEIGAWKGRSTATLALGSRRNPRRPQVRAIDPFTGSKEHRDIDPNCNTWNEFHENISNLGLFDVVQPIQKTSRDAYKDQMGAISLLFIDGSHEYEDVEFDFKCWGSNVIKGGWICMHDINWEGPYRVFEKYVYGKDYYRYPESSWGSLVPIQVLR